MEPNNQPPVQGQNNDKTMAIIAYILFFVPLLAGKRSQFVTYHTNQGTLLFIFAVVLQIILPILIFIPLLGLLFQIARIIPLVLLVIGIINASKGEMKPLPLIGGYTIIK